MARRACAAYYNDRTPAFVGSEIMTTFETKSIYSQRMVVLGGKIYAATEASQGVGNANLFEWSGGDRWTGVAVEIASVGGSYLATNLTLLGGEIYCAGVNTVDAECRLYKWDGVDGWTDLSTAWEHTFCMINFGEELFMVGHGSTDDGYRMKKWNGTNAFVNVAQYVNPIIKILECNAKIYGISEAKGTIFEWNGTDTFTAVTTPPAGTVQYGPSCEHNGSIYAFLRGTSPSEMYAWYGSGEWTLVATATDPVNESDTMYSYGTSLFLGYGHPTSIVDAKLYQWDGGSGFTFITEFLNITPANEHKIYSLVDTGGYLYALTEYHLQRVSTGSTQSITRIRLPTYRIEV